MLIRVLGDIDIVGDDGEVRPVASRSQRSILAVLAAHAGAVVSPASLIDAVWGDVPPATADRTLRTYVSRLRSVVGERIEISPGGYRLAVDDDLDVVRFERLLDERWSADEGDSPAVLEKALLLHRGAAFADMCDLEAVRPAAVRLDELAVGAEERLARALSASDRPQEAVAAAERIVAAHPLRERSWIVLIGALAASGRSVDALRAYQRAIDALASVGLEPSAELRAAEAAVLTSPPPPPAPEARPLPSANSELVGRATDLAAASKLVRDCRIVTLVGPGGVGKTRLSLAVAEAVGAQFEWGARFVELDRLADPFAVPDAVAHGLGLAVGRADAGDVLASAGSLDLLAVIDNAEHVIDAVAEVVHRLTSTGTRLRVLVTSREPLNIEGERVAVVHPLTVGVGGTAEALFRDRARRLDVDVSADDGDAQATVTSIVRLLDGLPLAVEMAASSTRSFTLDEILARLQAQVEPSPGWRRVLADRHRTLAGLVEWSLRLLDQDERQLCDVMAQFAGRVTAEDVSDVAGDADTSSRLRRLVERSLVVVDTSGSVATFGMLRVVRVAIRAGVDPASAEQLRRRHAEWIVAALERADRALSGPDEPEMQRRIEQLLDDARHAMRWSLDHEPAHAARIASALYVFAQAKQRNDVLAWAAETVERSGLDDRRLGRALVAAAHHAANRGELGRALALAERAMADGDPRVVSSALEVAGDIAMNEGDLAATRSFAARGVAVGRMAGDTHCIVVNLVNMVLADSYAGRHAEAAVTLADAPDTRELGPSDRAWLRYVDGERILDRDPVAALAALDESIVLADSVGSRYVASVARVSASSVRARTGDAVAMCLPFVDLLGHWRREGDRTHLLTTLRNVVFLFERLDLPHEAAELLGAVSTDAIASSFGDEKLRLARARRWMEDAIGAKAFEVAFERGSRHTIEDEAQRVDAMLRSRA